MLYKLVILDHGRIDRSISLRRSEVLIGRRKECDVVLDDRSVSGQHARLEIRGDKAFLEDMESTNGTRMGGQPITERQPLQTGDQFQIGRFKLIFVSDKGDEADADATIALGADQRVTAGDRTLEIPRPDRNHRLWLWLAPVLVLGGGAALAWWLLG